MASASRQRIKRQIASYIGAGVIQGAGVAPLQMNDRMVFEGDSITASSPNNFASWPTVFNALNRGALYFPVGYMKAVGGKALSAANTNIPNVLALNPKVVSLLIGTNNLPGATNATTIFNQIKAIVDAYLAGGVQYVIVGKLLPRQIGGTSTYAVLTAGEELIRLQVNDMIAMLASARVKIIDIEAGFDKATDLVADGLHPTWKGAKKYATAVQAAVTSILSAGDPLTAYYPDAVKNVFRAGNANATLSGVGGTKTGSVTGEVADGWTVNAAGGITVVCSKVDNGDGTFGQRLQISGTSDANARTVNLTRTVGSMSSYGAVGDYFEQLMQFDLAAGALGCGDVQLFGTLGTTPYLSSYFPLCDQALSGVFRTSPTGTLNNSNYTFNCGLVFAAGAVAADITLTRPVLQKLPFLPA